MCFAHNIMFRTLNAITLQYAQLTQATDIADFLTYCQCFHEMVHSHHHHEETELFPAIEAYSGEKGIMDTNFEQHQAFEEGLKKFGEYVYSVKPEDWDKETFKRILESFLPALTKHLREEIPTLLALDKYGGDKLKKAWADMEKKILNGSIDPVRIWPSCRTERWGERVG
jgi:hemerythrin-like domain-containing protein